MRHKPQLLYFSFATPLAMPAIMRQTKPRKSENLPQKLHCHRRETDRRRCFCYADFSLTEAAPKRPLPGNSDRRPRSIQADDAHNRRVHPRFLIHLLAKEFHRIRFAKAAGSDNIARAAAGHAAAAPPST